MSKWTEIRDTVVEALQVEAVGKNLKDEFIKWLTNEGIALCRQPLTGLSESARPMRRPKQAGARFAMLLSYPPPSTSVCMS